ncbi:MAG: helix-turn-helix domain-containing protein [Flavobacteriaceae bacterium]
MEIEEKLNAKQIRSGCPIATSLDLVGDKWSLLVVRDLFLGRYTFTTIIKNNPERIATNILADRLKKLVSLKIIGFSQHATSKKVKQYYLTDLGVSLYPILYDLLKWSSDHFDFELHPIAAEFMSDVKNKSREEIIDKYSSNYTSMRLELFGI